MIEKNLSIDGMHCKKCAAKVEAALKAVDAGCVIVNPDQNEASAFFENEIADLVLYEAIRKAGFTVTDIR